MQLRNDNMDNFAVVEDNFLLQEYERLYISNRKSISSAFFRDMSRAKQQQKALEIVRFAIENYLRWTPRDVKNYMTRDVLVKLKLLSLVHDYIEFPPEYSKNGLDMTYLAYLLYPNRFHLSIEDQCIAMFHRVYEEEIKKYPATWINSTDGILRLGILIRYVISQIPRFKNMEALYEYFFTSKGPKLLKAYKIHSFAITLFQSIPEAVHYSLPSNMRSDFLYNANLFEKTTKKLMPKL